MNKETEHYKSGMRLLKDFRAAWERSQLTRHEVSQLMDISYGTIAHWLDPGYESAPQTKYRAEIQQFIDCFPEGVALPKHATDHTHRNGEGSYSNPLRSYRPMAHRRKRYPHETPVLVTEDREGVFEPDLSRGLILGLLAGFLIGGGLAIYVCRML